MAGESVNAWDMAVLSIAESTFGTTPNPAATQAFECISMDTGSMEVGDVRGKKDRNTGRGMQSGFVEGRVKPIAWSLEYSMKSRATNATVPPDSGLLGAAGFAATTPGSNSVLYSLVGSPIPATNFAGVSLYRIFGKSPYSYEAEQLRGGVVKTINWSGGDSELMVKVSGEAIGKYVLGYSASVTLVDGSGTTLTFANAEEAYRFGLGWYQIESEVIKITARPTSTTATIVRAELTTTGAAHTAVPMRPYIPTLTYASGSPISEGGTVSVTVDGVTLRAMAFNIDFTTGMDMLPGESGSKYIQGAKSVRYDLKAGVKLVLAREQVSLLGKARDRNTCAITIVQSTGTAGGIVTFSLPYCEVMPFKVPDTANEVAIVDVDFRVRDNSGNDAFTLTLT